MKEAEQDKSTKENQACVFQPQLVSSYTPEYLKEMNFLERSYMWKRRIEQKLENQRKQKEEPDTITTAIRTSTPQINSSTQRISVSTELTDFFNINPKTSNLDQRKPAGKNLY